ncbi:alanine dehydrogenase [Clostridium tagluense]|uniref:alanine dehydrogenase n=1 Tax=Clostridium tagluense TaxID=360422 RepID=UPI001CF1D2B3|nr:alanine dehydrogenase [Clostridium tagluense]MCB2314095.1 alanine dehydrogenase [Clostridium tagluense]MCB2318932.1 alanine dehydrogenase [Clostridium tagluense]MCB2323823.1 alanine dehydrogenase [Clostridium tagluense]MCB2328653.1 alanine dehydrogenase [Clostridium tagluense]MCB2333537.1 alanine dehydrogenase [Clostridium tagluense]
MKTIGFPRMHKEINERRDFLPSFFDMIKMDRVHIFLEEGYGSALGYTKEDYLKNNKRIQFVSNRECYEKDIVVVLRSPEFEQIEYMKRGSTLLSMLHYATRATRVEKLKEKGIFAVSMDSIRNDFFERMVVNYEGTSENGINVAFTELAKNYENICIEERKPIIVSIMGMGRVGLTAARMAGKYGNNKVTEAIFQEKTSGVIVKMLPRNITHDKKQMIKILKKTDILVDATTRGDATKYVVSNELIGYLKEHSIILDLTADPYLTSASSLQIKAVEGMPHGTLDKNVIYPGDDEYNTVPKCLESHNQRTVVSCNAWPGVKPEACMDLYGKQLVYIVQNLIGYSTEDFDLYNSDYFNRAIYRATIECFEKPLDIYGNEMENVVI